VTIETKYKINEAVLRKAGAAAALAVNAAIEVAIRQWGDAETKKYGMIARDVLLKPERKERV
jgi:hypothetical protein